MIFDVALGLTWVGAGYRVWVSATRPRTVWRTSFTASLVSCAVAFTLYRFRLGLDAATGMANLAGLLAHIVFLVSAVFLCVYLDTLRMPTVPAARIRTYTILGAAAVVVMITSWRLAPVHEQPFDDLLPLADNTAVVVYCLTFWASLAATLALMAWTCLAEGRTFRRNDPARSVSLLLIGFSGIAAIVVVALWTASLLATHVTGQALPWLNAIGDALLPWPLLTNAIGVLSLLTVPYLGALLHAARVRHDLRTLWAAVISRYPDVHLPIQLTGGPLLRVQTRNERAIIEIRDALRIIRDNQDLGIDDPPALVDVATATRYPIDQPIEHPTERPSDPAGQAGRAGRADWDRGTDEILALARSYRRSATAPGRRARYPGHAGRP